MEIDQLDTGIPSETSTISVFLHLPRRTSADPHDFEDDHVLGASRSKWRTAFEQCHHSTLRSLSFPSHSGAYLAHGPGVDLEVDTKQSVMSILASGLPLPKSPSLQMDEVKQGILGDATQLEREERGWWALRFQQVFRELQRQELPVLNARSNLSIRSRPAGLRRVASSPRPLKLIATTQPPSESTSKLSLSFLPKFR